jgi:hypothetical protein
VSRGRLLKVSRKILKAYLLVLQGAET